MSIVTPAKIVSAVCQPNLSISATPIGEYRNCPNEPAAVPAPKASERQLAGSSLPKAPITRLNEQPDSPSPIITPAVRSSVPGVVACAISASPSAYRAAPTIITRLAPKRSAMPPAKGWPMPHNKFWIASATEKTSRPQWCSCDSGVRKKPSEERGPKADHARSGSRKPRPPRACASRSSSAAFPAAPCNDIAARLRRPIDAIRCGRTRTILGPSTGPKRIIVITSHLPRAWLGARRIPLYIFLTSSAVVLASPQIGSPEPSPQARGR